MSVLAARLLAIHDSLTEALLPHAFGGAIALAYCTQEPRGTRDIDVNIFAPAARAAEILQKLPPGVTVTSKDTKAALRDGQVRVWWDDTPVDVFLNTVPFHQHVAQDVRWVPFGGLTIPVLGCVALVVFKALFDRTKDWADIEAIIEAGAIEVDVAMDALRALVGSDHLAAERLASLGG